ncbi:MAG TPA: ZIP family metal transporter [Candidatus Saccharimonadales bacterium]|nr:ZIP family metal transporter [Candidatus Saccharimonadales bacterium]
MLVVLLAFATFISTMLGGYTALKNQDRLHRILGFTAGVLLGVVAFDLLPEIFKLVGSTGTNETVPMVALVIGFLGFHVVEKFIIMHHAHDEEYEHNVHPHVGVASASALIGHSFLDGVGIGLAFQVSTAVGLSVAIAVIAHDFADGLNTVSVMLRHKNSQVQARRFLLADAIAPVLGAASTLVFHLSDPLLLIYLGAFTGFLLYVGASDILPEAHAKHSSIGTVGLTVLGTLFIFIVTRFT